MRSISPSLISLLKSIEVGVSRSSLPLSEPYVRFSRIRLSTQLSPQGIRRQLHASITVEPNPVAGDESKYSHQLRGDTCAGCDEPDDE